MSTDEQPDFSQLAQPFIHRSRSYFDKIKSSLITKDSLIELYKKLASKATEAAKHELNLSKNLSEHMPGIFEKLEGKLWVEIWGNDNEYISGDHESVFDDTRLPKKITRVKFNSYNGYHIAMQNNQMHNWFELELDFKKNNIFDFSRISDPANKNNSYYKVQGVNETWVDGVYQAINSFLKNNALKRNWLYYAYPYDALLYLLFFPLLFRTIYKLQPMLNTSHFITPLTVVITIYILMVSLITFRTFFNYVKWVFPIIEFENGNSVAHRTILGTVILGLGIATFYDFFKSIVFYFIS